MSLTSKVIFLCCIVYLHAVPFDTSKENIFPSLQQCGHQYSTDDQVTQYEANEKEFPWIVYIPLVRNFGPRSNNSRCTGVLISKRYVLLDWLFTLGNTISTVQLGVHDSEVTENVTVVDVERIISMNYKVKREWHRIAMLRLAKDVEFSDYVQPICLPWEELNEATIGEPVYTSGWGLWKFGESNNIKKKIEEKIIEKHLCNHTLEDTIPDESCLCLEVQENSFGFPCDGDGGSPIMYNSKDQWIVSAILTKYDGSMSSLCNTGGIGSWKINNIVLTWILQNVEV